jgi:hypothetical protein
MRSEVTSRAQLHLWIPQPGPEPPYPRYAEARCYKSFTNPNSSSGTCCFLSFFIVPLLPFTYSICIHVFLVSFPSLIFSLFYQLQDFSKPMAYMRTIIIHTNTTFIMGDHASLDFSVQLVSHLMLRKCLNFSNYSNACLLVPIHTLPVSSPITHLLPHQPPPNQN